VAAGWGHGRTYYRYRGRWEEELEEGGKPMAGGRTEEGPIGNRPLPCCQLRPLGNCRLGYRPTVLRQRPGM
jgi:hypothetical protein